MLSMHDLKDFMEPDAVPTGQTETPVERNSSSGPAQYHAADAPETISAPHPRSSSVQDAYLEGIQNLFFSMMSNFQPKSPPKQSGS